MSHISLIKAELKSLESIKKACKRLGLKFMENQMIHKWYGYSFGRSSIPDGLKHEDLGKCLHAIIVPNADYEIGIIKDPSNPNYYKFSYDNYYDGGLEQRLGKDLWKLTQAYEIEHCKYAARLQGKIVREKIMDDRIRLVVQM